MCGIFASYGENLTSNEVRDVISQLGHRGPDATNHLSITGHVPATLVHCRLSILDLSNAGKQPMCTSDGRYFISFNGEIYNYRELRHGLNQKFGAYNWQSESDTEVLLRGFELEGKSFFAKLNGMFAFVILDVKTGQLLALRDPFGIKPLFLSKIRKGFLFSSEIKALACIRGVDKSLNVESLKSQLTFMYIPEPDTLFSNIKKLLPGQLYRFDGDDVSQENVFHLSTSTDVDLDALSDHELVSLFRDKFDTAVRRQLVSDVPVGVMLSGGLDSASVFQSIFENGSRVEAAFTLNVDKGASLTDQQSDDFGFAKQLTDLYGVPLVCLEAKASVLDDLETLATFFEDGFSDPAALGTYYLSQLAREQGVKVLMTGQGADEILFGYRRYVVARMLASLPSFSRLSFLAEQLPVQVVGRFNSTYRRFKRLVDLMVTPKSDQLASMFAWTDQGMISSVFVDSAPSQSFCRLGRQLNADNSKSVLQRLSEADVKHDLMSLNLTYCDRMSMAAGVEARVPFLDLEFAAFCLALPDRMKIRGSCGKFILKKAMESRLPNNLIYREKAGFGLPIRSWLQQLAPLVDRYMQADFLAKQGIFNHTNLQAHFNRMQSGQSDSSYFFLSYLVLQQQIEKFGLS